MKVSEAMSRPAVSVPTRTPLRQVAREMAEYGVGSVIVTEGDTLRGIVTDRDLALAALARSLDADEMIDSVMTSPVITVDVTDDIHVAYRTFRRSGFRRLPVLDGHRVVGVLTVDDMLIDVFQRLADLLGPVARSVLEEQPGPPSADPRSRGA
ncbi:MULTISPECIES: CBS domain-containing protein [unclassified Streptomyces]|uniref:CBS domain-containing protein n=1 Tax=unclassified Streptomyces TaxID=2593676 RepID=UPI0006F2D8C5|nr:MULTISPECIES: CBS domain-containing protein [unclassified Streptomyces]KQX51407.1 histidine kinase [Streptomyces sp. Root1304]KRA85574.1 histidine kinase [Streptomyces sp. Root66D1]